MSGIAAIFCSDGKPASAARVRSMSACLAHRGPDAAGEWIEGPVGFAHRALWSTPEAIGERQPFRDAAAGIVLVMDGRLDARDELLADLRSDTVDRRAPDSAIVAAAYQRWGLDCFRRLVGDFAIVIWDERERRIVAARDPIGIRPLYYRYVAGELMCASELACIVRALSTFRPNEGMIAECLANAVTSKTDTLVDGVQRLAGGHAFVAAAAGLRTFSYWTPAEVQPLRYRHAEDYAAHVREVAVKAVKARLRASGTVGVMVSGGVDSSSVAGIADRVVGADHPCEGLEMFSLSTGDADDETSYARSVAARLHARSHVIRVRGIPSADEHHAEIARSLDMPTYPSATIGDSLRRTVQSRGIRVLLTGIGGDEWFGSTSWRYSDLFRQFRWTTLGREIAADLRTDFVPGRRAAVKATLWPLVSPALRRRIRAARRRLWHHPWVDPQFARRTGLNDRLEAHDHGLQFRSNELSDLWHEGTCGWSAYELEMLDRSGAQFEIEHRHPFHDRRLIELAFALPLEERRWRGASKRVLRRSMSGVLPDEVAVRVTSPSGLQVLARSVEAYGADAFDAPAGVRRGWIRGDRVRRAYEEMRAGLAARHDPVAHAGGLWMVYGVEQWARIVLDEEHHAATRDPRQESRKETVRQAAVDRIRQRREADDERRDEQPGIRRPEQDDVVPVAASAVDVARSR